LVLFSSFVSFTFSVVALTLVGFFVAVVVVVVFLVIGDIFIVDLTLGDTRVGVIDFVLVGVDVFGVEAGDSFLNLASISCCINFKHRFLPRRATLWWGWRPHRQVWFGTRRRCGSFRCFWRANLSSAG